MSSGRLTKNGAFATKDGAFVTTDDALPCKCCGCQIAPGMGFQVLLAGMSACTGCNTDGTVSWQWTAVPSGTFTIPYFDANTGSATFPFTTGAGYFDDSICGGSANDFTCILVEVQCLGSLGLPDLDELYPGQVLVQVFAASKVNFGAATIEDTCFDVSRIFYGIGFLGATITNQFVDCTGTGDNEFTAGKNVGSGGTAVVTIATASPADPNCCNTSPPGPPCPCPTFSWNSADEIKEICKDTEANRHTSDPIVVPADLGDGVTINYTADDPIMVIGGSQTITESYDAGTDTITITVPPETIFLDTTHGNFSAGSTGGDLISSGFAIGCCRIYRMTVTGGTDIDGTYELLYQNPDAIVGGTPAAAASSPSGTYWWTDAGPPYPGAGAFGNPGYFAPGITDVGTGQWYFSVWDSGLNATSWTVGGAPVTCPSPNVADWSVNENDNAGTPVLSAIETLHCGCWTKKVYTDGTHSVTISDPLDTTTSMATFAAAGFTVKAVGEAITADEMSSRGWVDGTTKCATIKLVHRVSGTGFYDVDSITCNDGMP